MKSALSILGIVGMVIGCGSLPEQEAPSAVAESPFEIGDTYNAGGDVCIPGERYVCDCGDGTDEFANHGNKFCRWDGTGFGPCELCGIGPHSMGDANIDCNQTPPNSPFDPPLLDCPKTEGVCWGYQCDNMKKRCVKISFIESAILPDDSPNDCHVEMCDGDGNIVVAPYPLDCMGSCDNTGTCN